MYQSVDDIDESSEALPSKGINRLKVSVLILAGVALLISAAIFSAQKRPVNNDTHLQHAEQRAVYLTAMTERDPALRRARLLDFIQTYPKNDRVSAAQEQLDVIQAAEAKDWAALTDVVYEPAQSEPAKLAALGLYEEIWGTELLGGRADDMERLKSLLGQTEIIEADSTETITESQDFTPPPDRFDDSISGTEMAGGVVIAERSYIPPAPPVETIADRRGVVIEPTIRKNVRPQYPSRALRKGYGAEIVLAMDIDDEGRVKMTELVSVRARKYQKDFIKAAERAALKTRFNPKMVNGRPVTARGVTKRFIFRVED